MATPPRSDEELQAYAAAFARIGTKTGAAVECGYAPSSGHNMHLDAVKRGFLNDKLAPSVPVPVPLPSEEMDTADLLAWRRRAFERKQAHHAAKRWRQFNVPVHGPYALMFFGDPHVDDDGCHLSLLEAHCDLAKRTDALFAVNIGDTSNNWAGRLEKLWAQQEASARTARQLSRWLLNEAGVPWFLWLHGNHDLWSGPVNAGWFEAIKPHFVTMEDWQTKVTLVSPDGHELRLWAAHNFKGTSQWNPLHGPLKAAQMGDWAHLYVAGHHHNWGIMQGEHDHRGFVYNVVRARGYKFIDDYANQLGFGSHRYGASVLAVIDPQADKLNAVTCYADPFEGADVLAFKRRRLAA